MGAMEPPSVMLTLPQRDAIFEEIVFAFESAGDLPFMLEHGAENAADRADARDLISRLHVALRLLDRLGWERRGDREGYIVEVDEALDWFAERIESYALAGLEYNRQGLLAGGDRGSATVRQLIDSDLEKLGAARAVRTAFNLGRGPEGSFVQPLRAS